MFQLLKFLFFQQSHSCHSWRFGRKTGWTIVTKAIGLLLVIHRFDANPWVDLSLTELDAVYYTVGRLFLRGLLVLQRKVAHLVSDW